jgi:hypothetical protein
MALVKDVERGKCYPIASKAVSLIAVVFFAGALETIINLPFRTKTLEKGCKFLLLSIWLVFTRLPCYTVA